MFRGVTDIIQGLAQVLPPEVLAAVLGVALIVAFPMWLNSVRLKQIKAQIRRSARAPNEAARQAHYDTCFAIAKGRPRRLIALAEMAFEKRLTAVWTRALTELEATGKAELDVLRLRRLTQPKRASARDVVELEVKVERLLEDGLFVAAQELVDDALIRDPQNPEVHRLHGLAHAARANADEIRPSQEVP